MQLLKICTHCLGFLNKTLNIRGAIFIDQKHTYLKTNFKQKEDDWLGPFDVRLKAKKYIWLYLLGMWEIILTSCWVRKLLLFLLWLIKLDQYLCTDSRYSDFPIISTVPIKGTVQKFSITSLINVQYNLKKQWFFY